MKTYAYSLVTFGSGQIRIGRQGENLATRIDVDVTPWKTEYPSGTVSLFVVPPVGNGYLAAIEEDGNTIRWAIRDTDTAYDGHGKAELILTDASGTVIKSVTAYTICAKSPSADEPADPPEAIRPWVEQILEAIKRGDVSAEAIAAAVEAYIQEHGVQVEETDPTVPSWAKQPSKPTYTAREVGARPDTWTPSASDVGADAAGTASGAVSAHNVSGAAHADLRALIEGLTRRLNTLADSDDTTLDQLSEIVAYIKSNKALIDAVTTGKVSTSDIVDNLTTNASGKVLSAAQGVALKAMIDGIVIPTALPNPQPITINGQRYDGSEAVTVTVSSDGEGTPVEIDDTLTQSGKAADAKAVGDQLSALNEAIDAKGDPTDEQVKNAVDDYLTKNPASVITSAAIQDINIKKWIGRKIVVDGSSITSGGTGAELPTWPSFIKDIFALSAVYNHAVSGTPWFVYGASNVMSRVAEYETDADAVIIMGDYNGIGTVTSNESIDDQPSLDGGYYAKLKYLAETLIEKYPLCPIIWVVEPPRGSGECTPMHHDGAYVRQGEMIEEVAELYGFAHCNLMKNTLFRPWVQANYDATTKDGTHPWNNIQRTMAQIIAETMKRTPIIYQESYVLDTSGSTGSGSGGSGDAGGEENPEVNLTEIKASLSSSYEMYTTDTLDALRQYLTVKAVYSDLSEKTVTDYAIIGELTEGTSTLTIEYNGATTTVNVTVSSGYRSITVEQSSLIASNYNGKYIISATVGESRSTIGLKDYANTGVSDPISVMPGTVVRFFSNPDQGKGVSYPSLTSHDIVFFDAVDKIISSGNAIAGSWSFTVPDNASTFIVTVANNSTYYFISYTPGA